MGERAKRPLMWVGLAALALLAAWPIGRAQPGGDDSTERKLQALSDRLTALEKAVGVSTNAVLASESLTGRLERLEGAVRDLLKATGGTSGPTVGADVQALERTVRLSERQGSELARRLDTVERSLRDKADSVGDLRELRSDVSNLRRAAEELDRRVRRLEK